MLEDVYKLVKKGMPSSMAADLDAAVEKFKKEGIPTELHNTIREVQEQGLSPARAAKLWRLTNQMARQTADQIINEGRPDQKTTSDPAPQQQQQQHQQRNEEEGEKKKKDEKKKKEDPLFNMSSGELKFDFNNFLVSAFLAYLLYRLVVPSENGREITWQEFRTTFFDKGLVEKLIVINNNFQITRLGARVRKGG